MDAHKPKFIPKTSPAGSDPDHIWDSNSVDEETSPSTEASVANDSVPNDSSIMAAEELSIDDLPRWISYRPLLPGLSPLETRLRHSPKTPTLEGSGNQTPTPPIDYFSYSSPSSPRLASTPDARNMAEKLLFTPSLPTVPEGRTSAALESSEVESFRVSVLDHLKSETLHFPDLRSVFHGYPAELDRDRARLQQDINQWLDHELHDHEDLELWERSNFDLLGAAWGPQNDYERLKTLTLFFAWLLMFSSQFNDERGRFSGDPDAAHKYRGIGLAYLRACLGLAPEDGLDHHKPDCSIIYSVYPIAAKIRDKYNDQQKESLASEVRLFLEITSRDQLKRLNGVPGPQEYLRHRVNTSITPIFFKLFEFALGDVELPAYIWADEDMRDLCRMTALNLGIVNDLQSFQQDPQKGGFNNLIPILYARKHNPDLTMETAMKILRKSIMELRTAAERLTNKNPDFADHILRIRDAAMTTCSANSNWWHAVPGLFPAV